MASVNPEEHFVPSLIHRWMTPFFRKRERQLPMVGDGAEARRMSMTRGSAQRSGRRSLTSSAAEAFPCFFEKILREVGL
jgi:hypothetical protein